MIESNLKLTYNSILYLSIYGSFADEPVQTIVNSLIIFGLVVWIFASGYWLLYHREKLKDPKYKAKCESLYSGVRTDGAIQVVFIPIFCLRRLALVVCLFALKDHQHWLLLVYLVVYSAYFYYLLKTNPHESNAHNILEQGNEIGFILLHYAMFFFVNGDFVKPHV